MSAAELKRHLANEQPHLLKWVESDICKSCSEPVTVKDAKLCAPCEQDAADHAREIQGDYLEGA